MCSNGLVGAVLAFIGSAAVYITICERPSNVVFDGKKKKTERQALTTDGKVSEDFGIMQAGLRRTRTRPPPTSGRSPKQVSLASVVCLGPAGLRSH